MRILLDHNIPESLRHLITDHEVHTAHYLGWDTLRNGELLRRTAESARDRGGQCGDSNLPPG